MASEAQELQDAIKLTVQAARWEHELRDKAVAWIRDVQKVTDTRTLEAYSAGFTQGFNEALAMLRLHGKLKA